MQQPTHHITQRNANATQTQSWSVSCRKTVQHNLTLELLAHQAAGNATPTFNAHMIVAVNLQPFYFYEPRLVANVRCFMIETNGADEGSTAIWHDMTRLVVPARLDPI